MVRKRLEPLTVDHFQLVSSRSINHFHEVWDLGNHSPHFLRVDTHGDPVHLSEAERLEGLAHFHGATDAAADLTDLDGLVCFLGGSHAYAPASATAAGATSSSRPRRALYSASLR